MKPMLALRLRLGLRFRRWASTFMLILRRGLANGVEESDRAEDPPTDVGVGVPVPGLKGLKELSGSGCSFTDDLFVETCKGLPEVVLVPGSADVSDLSDFCSVRFSVRLVESPPLGLWMLPPGMPPGADTGSSPL
eukprot:CAMPEP_0197868664 /NCGR_PEP_ID=MMETSP1438-20131217/45403_1 /TAXON_ID=1461541 /ORGANISM="Pterosperma sp., Strain CCMP1384" /LENGTH=134 /DNA_ID=CAMNT_0043487381 /DNA_START=916 /DNA_END=1320 /DNA_ORIENTATION=-